VGNLDRTSLMVAIEPPESKLSACASTTCLRTDMGCDGSAAKNGGAYLSTTLERCRDLLNGAGGVKVARIVKLVKPPCSG